MTGKPISINQRGPDESEERERQYRELLRASGGGELWEALANLRMWEASDESTDPLSITAREAGLRHARGRLARAEKALGDSSDGQAGADTAAHHGRGERDTEQRQRLIREWLTVNGYDLKSLPVPPRGRPGVSAAARKALATGAGIFGPAGSTVFSHAWEGLKRSGEIADKQA